MIKLTMSAENKQKTNESPILVRRPFKLSSLPVAVTLSRDDIALINTRINVAITDNRTAREEAYRKIFGS